MACHVIWHAPALSPPYFVDPIHGMGAPGVGCGETMNDIVTAILVLGAVLFVLAIS